MEYPITSLYTKTNALAALLRFSFGTLRCWRLRAAAAAAAAAGDVLVSMLQCRHLAGGSWKVSRRVRAKGSYHVAYLGGERANRKSWARRDRTLSLAGDLLCSQG